MSENEPYTKIVDYAGYCYKCKFADTKDEDDPCNECLTNSVRTDGSRKPINFKEEE